MAYVSFLTVALGHTMPEPEQPQQSSRAARHGPSASSQTRTAEQTTEADIGGESETVIELLAFLRKEMAIGGASETMTELRAFIRTARERAEADINRIIARLDAEIPEAQRSMDALLSRLRTTRIIA
jgi:hypothetical protein